LQEVSTATNGVLVNSYGDDVINDGNRYYETIKTVVTVFEVVLGMKGNQL
jgi:hypothetical protein